MDPIGSDGQMLAYSLEVTTPATLPVALRSKHIAIGMIGSDGIPRMNFDDFQLEAARIPEPATCVAMLLAMGIWRRR